MVIREMTPLLEARENWDWAQQEFGHAELGHKARVKRLVALTASAVFKPSGTVTATFATDAEREGAYRWLENDRNSDEALIEASTRAALRRARAFDEVLVPFDPTKLTLNSSSAKDLGAVGSTASSKSQGLQVMNSVVTTTDGVLLGVGPQYYWARPRGKHKTRQQRRNLPFADKEIHYWLDGIKQMETLAAQEAPGLKLIFPCDRGADFLQMLEYASTGPHRYVIRSAWNNRRVVHKQVQAPELAPATYLKDLKAEAKTLGRWEQRLQRTPKRPARDATLEAKALELQVRLYDRLTRQVQWVKLTVVWVDERTPSVPASKRLSWRLFCNWKVECLQEAKTVVEYYKGRWAIEPFHRCWKSVCQIERTRLRSAAALKRWSIVMASVAARVQMMSKIAREEPERPASDFFRPSEIEATMLLRFKRHDRFPTDAPTVNQMVHWVSSFGGYTGPHNGPPGDVTLARGLQYIHSAAKLIEAVDLSP